MLKKKSWTERVEGKRAWGRKKRKRERKEAKGRETEKMKNRT